MTARETRITDGIRWLQEQFSASFDEFRQAHQPGGDMLLTGLMTGGYANRKGDRVAVSEQGTRRLAAVDE